jgi:16S rRNA (cytidine1402-2'-O)-methyltransferase
MALNKYSIVRVSYLESAIYIVATPIGNLSDITIRALEVLAGVDLIAAEDTRHTRKLLEHHAIKTKLISYHEHNETDKAHSIIADVQNGRSVALVSDAGTPLISDPGHTLVGMAKANGIKVVPIPGPSALIAALCASGIPCGRFIYEGFLPVKQKAKEAFLERFRYEERTVIFYESPHRIVDTLNVIGRMFPERLITIARELTKRFETITKGPAKMLSEWTQADEDQQRGEFVLVLCGADIEDRQIDMAAQDKLLKLLLVDLPPKKAVQIVAEVYSGDKKILYERAIALKN